MSSCNKKIKIRLYERSGGGIPLAWMFEGSDRKEEVTFNLS